MFDQLRRLAERLGGKGPHHRVVVNLFEDGYVKLDIHREGHKIGEIYFRRDDKDAENPRYSLYLGSDEEGNNEREEHVHDIEEAARHILSTESLWLKKKEVPAPVAFDPSFWSPMEQAPSGEYAMWWPTEDDPSFARSEVRGHIGRAYRAAEGIESYVLAELLYRLGILDQDTLRITFPDEPIYASFETPEGLPVVFSASREKGMRFHFHTKLTAAKYRNDFWQQFAEFVEMWRGGVEDAGAPFDLDAEVKPREWWTLTDEAVAAVESTGEPVRVVGAISY